MGSFTNRGLMRFAEMAVRAATNPSYMYLTLCTDDTAPTVDTNTMASLTSINAGSGYAAAGYQLNPGTTDFDVLVEDDTLDRALVQIKDVSFIANGGPIPLTGDPFRYLVLCDYNVVLDNRQVWAWFDFGENKTIPDGQTLLLQNIELRLTHP